VNVNLVRVTSTPRLFPSHYLLLTLLFLSIFYFRQCALADVSNNNSRTKREISCPALVRIRKKRLGTTEPKYNMGYQLSPGIFIFWIIRIQLNRINLSFTCYRCGNRCPRSFGLNGTITWRYSRDIYFLRM